ncbi:hypothetical protein A2U01_0090337, partial [Trifolium medium]|nr:hypothetical protein [Trifolium medium]
KSPAPPSNSKSPTPPSSSNFSVAFASPPPSPSKFVPPPEIDNRVIIYYTSLCVARCTSMTTALSVQSSDVPRCHRRT